MNDSTPRYAPYRWVAQHEAQVAAATLREWSRRGWVRTAKLGQARQAARLYCVEDVRQWLDRLAGCLAPRSRRRTMLAPQQHEVTGDR